MLGPLTIMSNLSLNGNIYIIAYFELHFLWRMCLLIRLSYRYLLKENNIEVSLAEYILTQFLTCMQLSEACGCLVTIREVKRISADSSCIERV